MGHWLRLTADDGHDLAAYRAEPEGTPRGGLVVAQEIFGVNSHIRAVCDRFAAAGYDTVAPALFDRVERDAEMGYEPEDIARGRALKDRASLAGALRDVAAARAAVAGSGRVGLIGYCWGGLIAWAGAVDLPGLACAISYYGGGVPDRAHETPNCPVLLHFGDQDHAIPLAGVEAMQAARPDLPIHIYPAGHGFSCDQRGSYHAESAALAQERSLAFLAQHVG